MLRTYRRFRAWTERLSRGAYAALVAAWCGGSMFAFGALYGYEPALEQAPILAVTTLVVCYVLDPRRFDV